MSPAEEAACRQLREIAADLEGSRSRLLAVHGSLPVSPREDLMLLGEEDPDFACEIRRAIECALGDQLEPLIRNLLRAAGRTPAI